MGYVNNPKKAVYNKIYNKTTVGIRDVVNSSSANAYDTDFEIYDDETNISYATSIIDIELISKDFSDFNSQFFAIL